MLLLNTVEINRASIVYSIILTSSRARNMKNKPIAEIVLAVSALKIIRTGALSNPYIRAPIINVVIAPIIRKIIPIKNVPINFPVIILLRRYGRIANIFIVPPATSPEIIPEPIITQKITMIKLKNSSA